MKLIKNRAVQLLFVCLLTVTFSCGLMGCNSSDGGGGGSTIAYTGATGQADVTAANGQELADVSYSGNYYSSSLGMAGAVSSSDSGIKDNWLPGIMKTISEKIDSEIDFAANNTVSVGATTVSSINVSGYEGTMTGTASYDDVSATFSYDLTFSSYKEYSSDKISFSGTVAGSGTYDVGTGNWLKEKMSMTNVSMSLNGTHVLTFSGVINLDYSSATEDVVSADLLMQDTLTGLVFKNQTTTVFTYDGSGNFVNMKITGSFYHPDYGYVTITNETILLANGEVTFILQGTSNNKVKLYIPALGSATYTADLDGDGTYETTF